MGELAGKEIENPSTVLESVAKVLYDLRPKEALEAAKRVMQESPINYFDYNISSPEDFIDEVVLKAYQKANGLSDTGNTEEQSRIYHDIEEFIDYLKQGSSRAIPYAKDSKEIPRNDWPVMPPDAQI